MFRLCLKADMTQAGMFWSWATLMSTHISSESHFFALTFLRIHIYLHSHFFGFTCLLIHIKFYLHSHFPHSDFLGFTFLCIHISSDSYFVLSHLYEFKFRFPCTHISLHSHFCVIANVQHWSDRPTSTNNSAVTNTNRPYLFSLPNCHY